MSDEPSYTNMIKLELRVYDLKTQVAKLTAERDELQQLFYVQHTRTVEADKLWQEAHGKPGVWPDLGHLVTWLIERHDTLRGLVEALQHICTCARPAIKLSDGGVLAPGPHTSKCVRSMVRSTLAQAQPKGEP